MNFFDSHCHFDFAEFDEDRESVWQSCQKIGLNQLLIPGTEPTQWQKALSLCLKYAGMVYSVGIHPYQFNRLTIDALDQSRLRSHLHNKHCVAIGETGLDKRIKIPLETQLSYLSAHLNLAEEMSKPIILHCVHAHNDMIRCLKQYKTPIGVIHGFSGSYEIAKQYIDLGFFIGVGGTITYQRANKTRQAISKLPMDSIVLETDAPDMPIAGKQGQRNSPAYLMEIAQQLAGLVKLPLEQVAEQTYRNAAHLFGIKTH